MARFFNPIREGKKSSTGSGKTFLLRRLRVRTLEDTIDSLYRFGGEWFFANLIEQNLSAVNCPVVCVTNPAVSGLVSYDTEPGTGIVKNVRPIPRGEYTLSSFVNRCASNRVVAIGRDAKDQALAAFNRDVVAPNESLSEDDPSRIDIATIRKMRDSLPIKSSDEHLMAFLLSGRFVTTWNDGVRRNSCEVVRQIIIDYEQSKQSAETLMEWFVMRDPTTGQQTYLFAFQPISIQRFMPGVSDFVKVERFMRLRYVFKNVSAGFNGTGIPRHAIIEGLTFPVVGGSTVKMSYAGVQAFPDAVTQASYASDPERALIDAVLMQTNAALSDIEGPVNVAMFAYAIVKDLGKACAMAERSNYQSLSSRFANTVAEDGTIIYSAGLARALYWAMRNYGSRFINNTMTIFSNTNVTDDEVSYVDQLYIRNHRFDLFKEWIVDPQGDIFIETLGQIWNRVTKTESTLKNGMSSGITRAFDAATGNAVWCIYVNRGDPDTDPVNGGYMAGLESGITTYQYERDHLAAYVNSSHRMTDRNVAHAVIRAFNSPVSPEKLNLLVFIDTPQRVKNRLAYFFLARKSDDTTVPTIFVGTCDAKRIIEERNERLAEYLDAAIVPRSYERVDQDKVLSVAHSLLKTNWANHNPIEEVFDARS